jgi:hypothetical protein
VRGFWQEAGNPPYWRHVHFVLADQGPPLSEGGSARDTTARAISRCSPGSSPTRWRGSSAPGATASVSSHGALGGMPGPPQYGGAPVTNICNAVSPHWQGWLGRRKPLPRSRDVVPRVRGHEIARDPDMVRPGRGYTSGPGRGQA